MSTKNKETEKVERKLPFQGKRVLIVDDSAVQRKKLRELYESMGFFVAGEATNGQECLDTFSRVKPHLVSLDVLMPVMHGVETLGYLRERGYEGRIVYVTSLGGSDVMGEVRALGHTADACFSKKDSREAFVEALGTLFAENPSPQSEDLHEKSA